MIVSSQFKPAWWLSNGHLQTFWPVLFRRFLRLEYQWEEVATPDDDFLDLVWSGDDGKPIVLIIHGLEGCIDSHYAKGLMYAINQAGYQAVFMHLRGCSGRHNRQPYSYHSGKTEDLTTVVQHIYTKIGAGIDTVVGFSLGGNLLLKWLGEQQSQSLVQRAVAVSVPFLLNDCAEKLEMGFSRIYQAYLLRLLHKKFTEKFTGQRSPLQVDDVKVLNTFKLFDDQVTAPLNGFYGVDDYYARCSCRSFLKYIKTPTLILHAKDDPFMFPTTIPVEDELSEYVTLELSDRGGHVGFIGGKNPFHPDYWLESRIVNYLHSDYGNP